VRGDDPLTGEEGKGRWIRLPQFMPGKLYGSVDPWPEDRPDVYIPWSQTYVINGSNELLDSDIMRPEGDFYVTKDGEILSSEFDISQISLFSDSSSNG
jgi:hypothetical protein